MTEDACVLVEATISTFAFVRLIRSRVKEVVIANTYELKQISPAGTNTDKPDADKLSRIIKTRVLFGEQTISPVTVPPKEIQEIRGFFPAYRLHKKRNTQLKNRIHSVLKEQLYGFMREEIFDRKSRMKIRGISPNPVLRYRVNHLLDCLEFEEAATEALKEQIPVYGGLFMPQIEILTGMKGGRKPRFLSVFIAIAVIVDIIDVGRFKGSKHFTKVSTVNSPCLKLQYVNEYKGNE